MKLELGMGNGAKKPVNTPPKRTVNLAKRESHSQSVMTLSIGTAVIIVLVVLVVKFGVLDQLARQSAAESAYNTVHAQYTEMQSAVEKYPEVEESTAPIPENGCAGGFRRVRFCGQTGSA